MVSGPVSLALNTKTSAPASPVRTSNSRATLDDVVAITAADVVVSAAGFKPVIAGIAEQPVFSGAADEVVVGTVAVHDVAEVRADEPLDAAVAVALGVVGEAARRDIDADADAGRQVARDVEAVSAEQHVGSGPADERVVIGAAVERIDAAAAVELIVADFAEQQVIAAAAVDDVTASTAADFIGKGRTVEGIVGVGAIETNANAAIRQAICYRNYFEREHLALP